MLELEIATSLPTCPAWANGLCTTLPSLEVPSRVHDTAPLIKVGVDYVFFFGGLERSTTSKYDTSEPRGPPIPYLSSLPSHARLSYRFLHMYIHSVVMHCMTIPNTAVRTSNYHVRYINTAVNLVQQ